MRCSHLVSLVAVLAMALLPVPAAAVEDCSLARDGFADYPVPPYGSYNAATGFYRLSQEFTPAVGYELCSVSVVLHGPYGPSSAVLYVQDRPCAGSTIYTQGSLSGIHTEGWYTFDVEDFDLVAGQTYYIRVVTVSGSVYWCDDASDTGPNKGWVQIGNGACNASVDDFYFICYTYEGIPTETNAWSAIKAFYR